MKAAYILEPGPAENILYGELPDPAPGPGQLLVRMTAVTTNHIDTFIRSGAFPQPLPRPFVIGRDMVGEVVALGSDVHGFAVGDRVWAHNQGYAGRQGTFAELLVIDQALLYQLPDGVEPERGVALLHSLLTACVALLGKAHARQEETVFLRGGSGAVGQAAIQLACRLGCRVATTAGTTDKAELCRELGAEAVFLYHDPSWEEELRAFAPLGVDVFWELSPLADLRLAIEHTAPRGRMLVCSGLSRVSEFPVGAFYTRNLSLFGFTVTDLRVDELAGWAQVMNGHLPYLRAPRGELLPLSQAAQAHRMTENGEAGGKVVLRPDNS